MNPMTLSQTPTATPAIVATAVSSGSNISAAVYDVSGNTFKIRTGFEDGENTAINADFSVMVVY